MAIVAHFMFPNDDVRPNFGTTLEHVPRVGETIVLKLLCGRSVYNVEQVSYIHDGAGSFEVEIECI